MPDKFEYELLEIVRAGAHKPQGPGRDPGVVGYGRDWWEALSEGGFEEDLKEEETECRQVIISDDPEDDDVDSERIAWLICRPWLEYIDNPADLEQLQNDLGEVAPSLETLKKLRELLKNRLFGQAVMFCADMIWDAGVGVDQDEI